MRKTTIDQILRNQAGKTYIKHRVITNARTWHISQLKKFDLRTWGVGSGEGVGDRYAYVSYVV